MLLVFTYVLYQQMKLAFWSRLRMLFLSSDHEGKSCYLRLIRVKRRALRAQQVKVNSLGLKGRVDLTENCFSCKAGFCFSAA